MTQEQPWGTITTLGAAVCMVGIAMFPPDSKGVSEIVFKEPPTRVERNVAPPDLVEQVRAEQGMNIDPRHAEVSNPTPVQQNAIETDEAARKLLETLYEMGDKYAEALKLKDELDERVNQAPDPVNQPEVRPPPGQDGPSTIGPVEVYAGPYLVEDPRLTALDLKHAEDLHKLDEYTKGREEGLKSRYEGSPDLDGYLKSFGEMAGKQRESRLSEQAAERQQLLQEVGADQQRMVNQQQQFTAPVPPPPPPPPPIPPPTR